MKEQNIPHDKYSRISVLRVIQAYSRLGNVTRAKELAHELRSSGLTSDIPSDLKCDLTALCSAVPLDWNAIGRVLEGTAEVENVKSILGAALLQTTDESALRSAVQALDWRLHKVINRAAFLAVTTNKIAQAQKVLQMTQLITKSLDSDCFSAILWYYIKGDQIGKAEELLRTMESIGVIPDVVAFTGVISARCKQMPPNESAVVALFNRMLELSPVNPGTQPNIITFNQMVTLFAILKKPRQALNVVAKMRQLGVKPNAATYSSLLGHDNARQAWQEMKSDGVVLDAVLTDSLLRIFLTMNNIGLAYDVWSVSKEHNVQLSRRRLDHLARYLRSAKLYEKAIEVTSAANLAKD
jgi:pentatricopeptide repeat protein